MPAELHSPEVARNNQARTHAPFVELPSVVQQRVRLDIIVRRQEKVRENILTSSSLRSSADYLRSCARPKSSPISDFVDVTIRSTSQYSVAV